MKKIILAGAILSTFFAQAQQGIGTNAPSRSSVLELNSTKRGLLIPRIQLTATNAPNPVNEPANSLLVYNTADAGSGNTAVTPGFYFWNGTENKWVRMIDSDNQSIGKNIYTVDGEIPTGTTRTVTMADDTANITFTKAGGSNNNPLLIANGTIKMMAADMNSDARLKQNINDLSSNKIDDLRAVSYTWNVEGKKRGGNDKLQYGFIAQEIEKVYPNVVSTDKDGYKSVNYVQVIPILTKALQEERQINREQQKQLDQQAREIEKLKEMINKLAN